MSFLWSRSPSRSSESASPPCSNMLTALEGGGTVRAMALLSCPGHGASRAPRGSCLLPVQMKVQGLRSELCVGFDHGGQVTVSDSFSSEAPGSPRIRDVIHKAGAFCPVVACRAAPTWVRHHSGDFPRQPRVRRGRGVSSPWPSPPGSPGPGLAP